TEEELAAEGGEELPDREAMSLINANLAAPVNAAVALNVASDNSVAYANAQQTAPITQGI
ncbi:MAG: peptidoglycan-binding protein, partial [Acidimicrobiia bacterium]|nr:peptidoglycan-binding protein [Acidimicrobiia bacterium]